MELQPIRGKLDRLLCGSINKKCIEHVLKKNIVREERVHREDNGELLFKRMIKVVKLK